MFLLVVIFPGEEWGQEWRLNGKNNRNIKTNMKGNAILNGSGKPAFSHSGPHSFLVMQPNAPEDSLPLGGVFFRGIVNTCGLTRRTSK